MRRFLLTLVLCLLPGPVVAQEDAAVTERDRDFLTAFLEDNLSGIGRTVRIEGFRGALSSRATFDELTIADAQGIWITIREGAIGWNRSALLSGRVEISEMSAAEIDLPRSPATSGMTAEASGFSLPELPVSVDIGTLHAERVVLGEALFGAAAIVTLNGRMHLEGGEGTAELAIERTDGPRGTLSFTGSYANATRKATLDLLLAEEADGITANLLDLPERPSIQLAVHGDGVIDDFATDVALSTDGVKRLSGRVTVLTAASSGGAPERRFAADLRGDIAPLLLPDYRDFFGPDVALRAEGRRLPSGQLDLTRLDLDARGLDLSGRLSLAPEGVPLEASLTVRLGHAGGGELLLPLPGPRTFVRSGDLKLRYDRAKGEGWTLGGALSGYRRADLSIGSVTLSGSGRIGRAGSGGVDTARAGGTVTFVAADIQPADPAIAEALGPELRGRAIFSWQEGEPLRLPVFDVTGQGYEAKGSAVLTDPEAGAILSGRVAATVSDLGRFSMLAGRSLGGAGELDVSGSAGVLSGFFDVEASVTGRDLTMDQPEIDRLLAGESRIALSALRDTAGLTIRKLAVSAATLTANASGRLATGASDLRATLDFSDLSALGPRYRGTLTGEAHLTEAGDARTVTLDASGSGLGVGQPEVDRLLAGPVKLSMAANESAGKVRLETLSLTNPQLAITAEGGTEGAQRRIDVSARLADMAILAPGFPGPLSATGTVTETADGYSVDLSGEGPGATNARVTGTLAPDLSAASLSVSGGGQSAIVNPFIAPRNVEGPVSFDLRLEGPLALSSLSGRVALEGGRLVAPTFGIELEGLRVAADLAGGRATVQGSAAVRGGGEIALSGPVALAAPHDGDLSVRLSAARLRDPELFDTAVSGNLRVSGPLLGGATISGAVTLGRTEVRVPSTGLGADPVLREITHVGEPAAVHATRVRAGLAGGPGGAGGAGEADRRGPSFGLDLTINAPERIFVRGRGLDAELGGALRLTGTTDNIVPSGRFTLIRGRLDLLGKRFTIDEGTIELQGALTPYIRFAAESESNGITVTIVIEGEASAPEIYFLSSPELPEEEVMAQLLFGRGLTSLSPLQAAQLASAVAQLAGTGGEGIVGRLRSSFGLDDLDVTAAEDGSAAVRAGKYLSEKVYTDVTVGAEGKTEINLNLDIRPGVTARGTLGSDGSSGIGIYYERDY
ncbi:MAG: translocation/assembly module TamB domain-containing protein [Albidovulum sp.]